MFIVLSCVLCLSLPRCKNLTRLSLFVSFCFAVRYCLKCFCFLCFTSSVSFTGCYTEVKPFVLRIISYPKVCMYNARWGGEGEGGGVTP